MRLTVEEVANALETTSQTVRYGVQNSILPGSYVKADGNRRGSFIIHSTQLASYLKVSEEKAIEKAKTKSTYRGKKIGELEEGA